MDLAELLNFSLISWLKNKNIPRYVIFLWLSFILFYALFFVAILLIFGDILSALIMDNVDNYITNLLSPAIVGSFLRRITLLIALSLTILVVFSLVVDYIYFRLLFLALNECKIKTQKPSFNLFIRFILLQILTFLSILLYPRNKIMLVSQLFLLFLSLILFIYLPTLSIFVIILFFAYLAFVIYNTVRYSQAANSLLVNDKGIIKAIADSWHLTTNRFWDVFICYVITMFVTSLIIISIVTLLSAVSDYFLAFFIFNIKLRFVLSEAISNILIAPIFYIVSAFMVAFVYSELKRKKND